MFYVRNIMHIISLSSFTAGFACGVSDSIKKYFYNKSCETQFFDYLEVSLSAINQLLSLNGNDVDFINISNDFFINKNNHTSVSFNNFDKMISHHDLIANFNFSDYEKLLDKYIRRYKRLINIIQKENKIFFIRHGGESKEAVQMFFEKIQIINPNLNFYFIHIGEECHKLDISDLLHYNKKYVFVNIQTLEEPFKNYNEDSYFKMLELNWKVIYSVIQNRCSYEETNQLKYYESN